MSTVVESPIVQLARVPRGVPRVDAGIAAGLLVWGLLEALLVEGPGSPATRILMAVGFTLPLAVRRRWPIPALAVIAVVASARGVLGDVPEEGSMPFPVLLVATFSAALYARPAALAIAALPVPIVVFPLTGFSGDPTPVDWAILSFIWSGAWTAGWLVRRRAAQVAKALSEAPEVAREAVAAERARMARELHDVVAHSVSIISVQAGAAEELLERDPARAREHLGTVRRTAREALVELRRLVGVLREDEPVYTPQPGLWRLDELLAEARGAGLPVELVEDGERAPVPPGVDLTAYRVVQESLTNVRRHAGRAATTVRVGYGDQALALEVANVPGQPDGTGGTGSGHGLIGMRERVRLYGGTLDTRATPEGGFVVRARLPLESAPE